jgi:hypothetical protein
VYADVGNELGLRARRFLGRLLGQPGAAFGLAKLAHIHHGDEQTRVMAVAGNDDLGDHHVAPRSIAVAHLGFVTHGATGTPDFGVALGVHGGVGARHEGGAAGAYHLLAR